MCFCFNLYCFRCEGILCSVSHQILQQPGKVVKVFNLSIQEAETDCFCYSRSQGLCSELQASQDYKVTSPLPQLNTTKQQQKKKHISFTGQS